MTFRVIRPIKIGEELTTFYGDNYFGRNNIECLCLTCENANQGGFTPKDPSVSLSHSHSRSRAGSTPTPSANGSSGRHGSDKPSSKSRPPSSLRNAILRRDEVAEAGPSRLREVSQGPSQQGGNESVNGSAVESVRAFEKPSAADVPSTPTEAVPSTEAETPSQVARAAGEDEDIDELDPSSASESEESAEEAPRRERLIRQAVKNAKPIILKRSRKKLVPVEESLLVEEEELPEDFPRCATCVKPLMERIWYLGRYFDHCAR